jgi:REP element-mobilizing transposase RayT
MILFIQWFEKSTKFQVYNSGFVIMPNHLHMLAYTQNTERAINNIIGTGKRFMAYEIVKRLEKSERTELLRIMADAVTPAERKWNKKHEVFQDSLDCKEVITENIC